MGNLQMLLEIGSFQKKKRRRRRRRKGKKIKIALRGSLPKSGPLDFATKIIFLYFLSAKRLQQVYTKIAIFVFKFLFLTLLQGKNELSTSRPLRECFKD